MEGGTDDGSTGKKECARNKRSDEGTQNQTQNKTEDEM